MKTLVIFAAILMLVSCATFQADQGATKSDYHMAGLLLAKASPERAERMMDACPIIQMFDESQDFVEFIELELRDHSDYLNMNEAEAIIVRDWIIEKAGWMGVNIDPEKLIVMTPAEDLDFLGIREKAGWICEGIQAGRM